MRRAITSRNPLTSGHISNMIFLATNLFFTAQRPDSLPPVPKKFPPPVILRSGWESHLRCMSCSILKSAKLSSQVLFIEAVVPWHKIQTYFPKLPSRYPAFYHGMCVCVSTSNRLELTQFHQESSTYPRLEIPQDLPRQSNANTSSATLHGYG